MASKTLYDILEVSEIASPEAILAAWERLSRQWDPERPGNQTTMEARLQHNAIKDAYLTLGNANRREAYDRRLRAQWQAPVEKPSNSFGKIALLIALVLGITGYAYNINRQERVRLEAEKVIAAVKVKEAAEKARIELEVATLQRERDKAQEDRQRRQRDTDLTHYEQERRLSDRQALINAELERQAKARSEAQRRREEMEAAAAARQTVARDKAELCRLERQRYGRAISC